MRSELYESLAIILEMPPKAYAFVWGSEAYPEISGRVLFYPLRGGSLVVADIHGLPDVENPCDDKVLGFHIHEGSQCLPFAEDPFGKAGAHFNPNNCEHPEHAGDLPPLFVNHGYSFMIFYTDRFLPHEVIGRTVIIHDMADDFQSQPSGCSGKKIACGEIHENHE